MQLFFSKTFLLPFDKYDYRKTVFAKILNKKEPSEQMICGKNIAMALKAFRWNEGKINEAFLPWLVLLVQLGPNYMLPFYKRLPWGFAARLRLCILNAAGAQFVSGLGVGMNRKNEGSSWFVRSLKPWALSSLPRFVNRLGSWGSFPLNGVWQQICRLRSALVQCLLLKGTLLLNGLALCESGSEVLGWNRCKPFRQSLSFPPALSYN